MMNNSREQNYNELKELALREGIAVFGVADVREARDQFLLPPEIGEKLAYGISIGFRLSRMALGTVVDAPTQMYYFHYQRVNILLDQTTLKLAAWIQARGFDALPIPASQVIDWEKQLGSVSHREIARLAGLGWYGRNNLLVNPEYGSQVRYATVLTDLPLNADRPHEGACGGCGDCAAVCPAGAIGDNGFVLERCSAKLKEFTKIQRIGQMICGVCVKACPGRGAVSREKETP